MLPTTAKTLLVAMAMIYQKTKGANNVFASSIDGRMLTEEQEDEDPAFSWNYLIISVVLVVFAGMMSGLTVGLLSIDKLELELLQKCGTPKQQTQANKILPILDHHHWLLVTLLLCNAAAMEALPLFLDKMMPEYLAIITSVTAVLFFGEVIPQALCTGPNQLSIARYAAPVVTVLMWVTGILSWPIAKLLDMALGEHTIKRFNNDQLKALVLLHSKEALASIQNEGHGQHEELEGQGLGQLQTKIIEGAINLAETTTAQVTKPFNQAYMLNIDDTIDANLLKDIKIQGYSRIPIYIGSNKNCIIGILMVRSLIGYDVTNPRTIRDLMIDRDCKIKKPYFVDSRTKIGRILATFKTGKSHLAIVCRDPKQMINQTEFILKTIKHKHEISEAQMNDFQMVSKVEGLVTLENVLEKIMQLDILDEEDIDLSKVALNRKATVIYPQLDMSTTSAQPPMIHNASSMSAILRPSEVKFADTTSNKSAQSVYTMKKDSSIDVSKSNQEEMQAFISSLASTIKTKVKKTISDEKAMNEFQMRAESVNMVATNRYGTSAVKRATNYKSTRAYTNSEDLEKLIKPSDAREYFNEQQSDENNEHKISIEEVPKDAFNLNSSANPNPQAKVTFQTDRDDQVKLGNDQRRITAQFNTNQD